ncbi:hypothetical protein [Pyrococcus horikoshii]|nr:hypothetical protein [Pyrococcus horikoshii]
MGYSIYYKIEISNWKKMITLINRICDGLGFELIVSHDRVIIDPELGNIESLIIPKKGYGSVKTFGIEPITTIYLLILYSLSSFGSVEVWED